MRFKPPKIIRRLMPDLIWEIDDEDGVFLTFDDGPTPGVTEWILSTLDKYGAKATFFVLGKNVEMYPDLYKRILDAGHKVGNHTYSHQKGWGMSLERYTEDVDFANDLIHSELFRPPYARITPAQARGGGATANQGGGVGDARAAPPRSTSRRAPSWCSTTAKRLSATCATRCPARWRRSGRWASNARR